jgi:hypothetical protein
MMFLVLFGSLAVAMAIASQGNLRTAATHLHVLRSMGAAETGMEIAQARIEHAISRFVIERGEVEASFGSGLWAGTYGSGYGVVTVLPLSNGDVPTGIADALMRIHNDDVNVVTIGTLDTPRIATAPSGLPPGVYAGTNWVQTPAIGLVTQANAPNPTPQGDAIGSAFQITYAPLADGVTVRIIVTGYDFDHSQGGKLMSRTIMQDYTMAKRVDQAVVSPSRIMIGKNVLIKGDMGASFDDLSFEDGQPLILKSDFENLHATLDQHIQWFHRNLRDFDADNDNRLRAGHPIEGEGFMFDLERDGIPEHIYQDKTQDGFLDEFDLFLDFYDSDGDGRVALSDALRAGTINSALSAEFVDGTGDGIDDDLALLIDGSLPDRNDNGISGWDDADNNGLWDPGETFNDIDPASGEPSDHVLGFRDGVIDRRDQYAKVGGRLMFRADQSTWETEFGPLSDTLEGPVIPRDDRAPLTFGATAAELPDLSPGSFTGSQTALADATVGEPTFAEQVASNLGVALTALPTYVETGSDPDPQYYRLDPDSFTDNDLLPDNHTDAYFEKMPFNSPNFSDWYYRPVYRNMLFKNIEIPEGTNALFVNCTFVGVTWVRSRVANTHPNWVLYGRMVKDPSTSGPTAGRPIHAIARAPYTGAFPPDNLPSTALPPQQELLMPVNAEANALDKADFPTDDRPINYNDLPDPLVINGKRVLDTRPFSNNIRFHDCLFIGSITSDAPTNYTHPRNKLQFTGGTRFLDEHPDPILAVQAQYRPNPEDVDEIAKSSMMLPHYSVDIGTFNSPPEQDIRLKGMIISGIMDIRGNAQIDGALVMTFRPVFGSPPLVDILGNPIGNPAQFNATLGYFGPDDGDEESIDPLTLPIGSGGVRIVGYDTTVPPDGLADVSPFDPQPPGSVEVPFHGYGRIELRLDTDMVMPDGILLPLRVDRQRGSYLEGRL